MIKYIIISIFITTSSLIAEPWDVYSIPHRTVQAIKEAAAKEWPEDYRMQKYTADKQKDAYRKLEYYKKRHSTKVYRDMIKRAEKEWPGDYRMQVYEFEKQFSAYQSL